MGRIKNPLDLLKRVGSSPGLGLLPLISLVKRVMSAGHLQDSSIAVQEELFIECVDQYTGENQHYKML